MHQWVTYLTVGPQAWELENRLETGIGLVRPEGSESCDQYNGVGHDVLRKDELVAADSKTLDFSLWLRAFSREITPNN